MAKEDVNKPDVNLNVPPIRRGTGAPLNSPLPLPRAKVPMIYGSGSKTFSEDELFKAGVEPGTIVHRTRFDEGTLASRKRMDVLLKDFDLREQLHKSEDVTSNRASSALYGIATDKRRLGDAAAEEYASTGKTGGPISTLAADSIRRLRRNQTRYNKFLNPLEKVEAQANQSASNINKTLESDITSARVSPKKAILMDARSNALEKIGSRAYSILGERMSDEHIRGLRGPNLTEELQAAADVIRKTMHESQVLNTAKRLGDRFFRGLGVVGNLSMAADAANALVPLREKPAEMKSLDVLRQAVFDENNKPRTY